MELDLQMETLAFQAQQEGLRSAREMHDGSSDWDERIEHMEMDLAKAKANMEMAWLAATMRI